MKKTPHIIIIGAGLIGLSTADALLEKGAQVTLIERGAVPMGGASFANSGMVHISQARPWLSVMAGPHLDEDAGAAVLDLARRSAPLIAAKAESLGLSMNQRADGCMQIFRDLESWKWAQENYDQLGIAYRRQPAGGLLGDRPALVFANDRSGDAHAYGMALAADITQRGAKIITGHDAALLSEDGRVTGVTVDGAAVKANHIILAAGIGSAILAKSVGVNVPMKSVAGYSLTFLLPESFNAPKLPVMDALSRSCLTVFGNRLRLSGTVDADGPEALIAIWEDLIPGLSDQLKQPVMPPWRGERPVSLTGKPFIGRTSVPGLWVNTGHAHMGWTLCAGSGVLCADMVMDGASDTRFSVPEAATVKLS